jgi:hypothetical protein
MKVTLALLMLLLAALCAKGYRDDQADDRARAACLAWATTHVYPDGKRVVDDVDPVAWCQE